MQHTIRGAARTMAEYIVLVVAASCALVIPRTWPVAGQAASWRERNWKVWYVAHQMYRRDPEELTEPQLDNVQRWCRCDKLCLQCVQAGIESLTDDECQFVAEVLWQLCPNLEEHLNYFPIYEACRQRTAIALKTADY
jgi:hypothetical protein